MRLTLCSGSRLLPPLALLLNLPMAAQAQTTVPARLVEAALFKNGMAYLTREVDIPGPGRWRVGGLPPAVHGTFWMLPASSGLEIKAAQALIETTETRVPETQLSALLRLNGGRTLEVKTSEGWITCEVMGGSESESFNSEGKDHVFLKTDKGILVLPMGDIRGFRLAAGNLITQHAGSQSAQVVYLTTTGGKGKIRLSALSQGLAWAPSYQVDISDAHEAVVRGKAVLLNDLENLQGVEVSLIAGFPNLQFGHALDAFNPGLTLNAFMEGLSGGPSSSRSNILLQQAVLSNAAVFQPEATVASATPEEATQDLFFHKVGAISLQKGERHYQPMFEHRVPYQHVFVWKIENSQNDQDRWRENRGRNEQSTSREEIWHQLKLKHTGNVPWSTGPAMTVQQGRILGQDTLYFTPSGGETLMRITRAMDVTAEQSESEIQRLRDAPTPYSGHWDLVTIKGELQVANHRGSAANMVIQKDITGELLTTSLKPATHALPEGLKQVNRNIRLTWETPIPKGEKLKLTYTYKVLVSR